MSESSLQPVAFTLRPEFDVAGRSFATLLFPEAWREPLERIQAELANREGLPNTFQIGSLNESLRVFVPYLLTVPGNARKSWGNGAEPDPWLIAHEPIAPNQLLLIVRAWLEQTYQGVDLLPQVMRLLRQEDLVWDTRTFDLHWPTAGNHTAFPPSLAYAALPALLAERLISRKATVLIGGQQRALLRVPVEQGAEVMTWPPVYLVDKEGRKWGYSYYIEISLQTLVGNPEPRIHFHYRVRRWHNHSLYNGEKLALQRHRTSVYLHRTLPWLGVQPTDSFTVAFLKPIRPEDRWLPAWTNRVPEVARRLGVEFPDAEALASDPMRWLQGDDGVEAGVVWKTPRHHPVAQGIDEKDREALTRTVQDALGQELSLCSPLKRLHPVHKKHVHPLMDELRKMPAEDRLAGLARSVGGNVTIEIFWVTEAARDMLTDCIRAVLTREPPPLVERQPTRVALLNTQMVAAMEGQQASASEVEGVKPHRGLRRVRAPEPDPVTAPDTGEILLPGGGRLRIIPRPLGEIGSLLPASDKKFDFKQRTEERAKQIKEALSPNPDEPTLALVELPNYRDPRQPELRRFRQRDPKPALRLGMARAGRVTQFVTGEQKDLRHRCDKAARDGLRHLGYLPVPLEFQFASGPALPKRMIVAGVWIIRLTKRRGMARVHLPVVVLLDTADYQVRAWVPGKGVLPYHKALLEITTMNPNEVKHRKREEALQALQGFLQHDLSRTGVDDVVILLAAQNARQTWTGISNNWITLDHLRFAKEKEAVPLSALAAKMRLIRLRTYDQNETPTWYFPGEKADTVKHGIWVETTTARHFYDLGEKPVAMSGGRQSKQIDPGASFTLPTLLEVLPVAIQPDDQIEAWAYAVDQWRQMGFLTNDMTLLPLPLELARKMDEYAMVIGPWIFPEEWEEEEDEDEEEEEDDDSSGIEQLELFS